MGLYDREYTQAGSPSGFGEGFANSMMATKLVIITVAIYLIDNLFFARQGQEPLITGFFSLTSSLFKSDWSVWELLTYGFAHAQLDGRPGIWHIAGNMYGLWFFGREVERKIGSKEFLWLYLALIVLSGLVWSVFKFAFPGPATLKGASGAIAGLIVLYALNFPNRKLMLMFLPVAIPAWVLGLFIVGSDVLGAFGIGRDGVAFVVHLAGAALGALYFYSGFRLTDPSRSSGFRMPKMSRGPKLKVHKPRDESLDAQGDAILAKMSREGADSLTKKERKILDEYSRRVRNRRR